MGLYSVRLLTENYLRGKVAFHSSPEEGTVSHICLPLDLNLSEGVGLPKDGSADKPASSGCGMG